MSQPRLSSKQAKKTLQKESNKIQKQLLREFKVHMGADQLWSSVTVSRKALEFWQNIAWPPQFPDPKPGKEMLTTNLRRMISKEKYDQLREAHRRILPKEQYELVIAGFNPLPLYFD
jgi:hypothetical protein